jgi:solute carrier family 8 (sodium/calcium exchanger)
VNGGKKLILKKEELLNDPEKIMIGFSSSQYSVLENAGHVTIFVDRLGDTSEPLTVDYHCEDGTAMAESEYHPVSGTLEFLEQIRQLSIKIEVVDNNDPQPDRMFKVILGEPKLVHEDNASHFRLQLKTGVTEVTIIDDDKPGMF